LIKFVKFLPQHFHSDHRFNLLFRAVDSIGGDGCIEEEELVSFMFPEQVVAISDPSFSNSNPML
jgi:hypothetical protein